MSRALDELEDLLRAIFWIILIAGSCTFIAETAKWLVKWLGRLFGL